MQRFAGDDDVRLIASRAVAAVGKKFIDGGNDLTVTGSIGVVVTGDPLVEPGELLQQADIAMCDAKGAGRDGFRIFDASLHAQALANHDFDAGLRKAIENKDLFLLYQPLFSLEDQTLRGAEALVRWRHPERGVIPRPTSSLWPRNAGSSPPSTPSCSTKRAGSWLIGCERVNVPQASPWRSTCQAGNFRTLG